MRLAVSNLAWPATADDAVAGVLRAHGASGVELAPTRVWPAAPAVPLAEARARAEWWRVRGLEVVAFQAILFGRPELSVFSSGPALTTLQRHLGEMGILAAAMGAHVLVLGAPGNRRRGALGFDDAVRVAADGLRPVAVALAPLGVHLCVEPNPPRYGCDFVTTAAEAYVLAEAVGHPNFGVHLDAAALALAGETSPAALASVMPHVRHFHVSEVDLAPVGSATDVSHAVIGASLRACNYSGWRSIEMRAQEAVPWETAIPAALAVARACYGD